MMTRTPAEERAASLDQLRKWLPRGATVFAIRTRRTRSGNGDVALVAFVPAPDSAHPHDVQPYFFAWHVCKVIPRARWSREENALAMRLPIMSNTESIVQELARELHGDPQALTVRWLTN